MTSMMNIKIESLLSEMTLDEKIAQLGSYWMYDLQTKGKLDERKVSDMLQHGIGQLTRVAGATMLDPQSAAAAANELQRFLVTRHGWASRLCCMPGFGSRDRRGSVYD